MRSTQEPGSPLSPHSPCPPEITALVPGATQWAALQLYLSIEKSVKNAGFSIFLEKRLLIFFFLASILHFPGRSHLQCLLHLSAVFVPRTTSLPTHLVYYLPGLLSHWNLNPASWWQSPHCFPVCPTTTSQWHWTLKNPSFGPTPLRSHCLLPSFTLSRWKYPFIFHLHFHLSLPVNPLHLVDSLHSSQTLRVKVPGTLHLI